MTVALALASGLAVAVGAAHSILGERFILIRLFRRDDLPKLFGSVAFTTRTLRFAWHVTTIAWGGFAAILFQLAQGTVSPHGIAFTLGIAFLATAAVALVGSRGRHLSWVVFLIIGWISLSAAGVW